MRKIQTIGRRNRAYLSGIALNVIGIENPWIIACWSFFFPGFGHVRLGKYITAWVLIIWELIVNWLSHLNVAIMYTLTGQFGMAKAVLDKRMVFLYLPVFVFAMYDSYRLSVETNKEYVLADREDAKLQHFHIGPLEINFLDKKNPLIAVLWSFFIPGLGAVFNNRITSGVFILAWWISIVYSCHVWEAAYYTFFGQVQEALHVLNVEGFLFLPSMYGFAAYHAYCTAVEYNKLFEKEQSQYLRQNYQSTDFPMWIR